MPVSWLRLWHDMPNDPKWRTISKISKQPISSVIAVYINLLVIASSATMRGDTHGACLEDIASALDLDTEQVDLIVSAMQGRVLDGDKLTGWEKRQVAREDGSAERSKAWRNQKKEMQAIDLQYRTQPNATERKSTLDTDTDTDTDTDKNTDKSIFLGKEKNIKKEKTRTPAIILSELGIADDLAKDFMKLRTARRAPITDSAMRGIVRQADKAGITVSEAIGVCVEYPWTSFRADWYQKSLQPQQPDKKNGQQHYKTAADTRLEQDIERNREIWSDNF